MIAYNFTQMVFFTGMKTAIESTFDKINNIPEDFEEIAFACGVKEQTQLEFSNWISTIPDREVIEIYEEEKEKLLRLLRYYMPPIEYVEFCERMLRIRSEK